ncbi:hypothetical protein B6E78_00225 [Edwardsiella ictaluri]|nr:hypothetical protein B6E78_00225 [Edwardsiella ictaluri]
MARQKLTIPHWPDDDRALGSALRWRSGVMTRLLPHGLKTPPERRGRPLHYTDMAITAALMIKRECNLPHRALQGLINPTFKLMALPLQSDFLPTRLMYSHTPFATSVDAMRYHQ